MAEYHLGGNSGAITVERVTRVITLSASYNVEHVNNNFIARRVLIRAVERVLWRYRDSCFRELNSCSARIQRELTIHGGEEGR